MLGKCYGLVGSNGVIRYVGQTRRDLIKRLYRHRRGSSIKVREAFARGEIQFIIELGEAEVGEPLNELEIFLIEAYRSIGCADLNTTSGGTHPLYDDEYCCKMSRIAKEIQNRPEVKLKKSIVMNDPVKKSEYSRKMKETASTPESKKRRSVAMTAVMNDPVARAKHSASLKEAHRIKRELGLPWKGKK